MKKLLLIAAMLTTPVFANTCEHDVEVGYTTMQEISKLPGVYQQGMDALIVVKKKGAEWQLISREYVIYTESSDMSEWVTGVVNNNLPEVISAAIPEGTIVNDNEVIELAFGLDVSTVPDATEDSTDSYWALSNVFVDKVDDLEKWLTTNTPTDEVVYL